MSVSGGPYVGMDESEWFAKTQQLVREHPLSLAEILDVSQSSWSALWNTSVGSGVAAISLRELNPPATVVGYFFEKISRNST